MDAVIEQLDRFGLDKDEFDLLMEWGEKFIRDESMHFQSLVPSGTKMKLTRTFVTRPQPRAGGSADAHSCLISLTHVCVCVLFDSLFSFCCFACFSLSWKQGSHLRKVSRGAKKDGGDVSKGRGAAFKDVLDDDGEDEVTTHQMHTGAYTNTAISARVILLFSDRTPPS